MKTDEEFEKASEHCCLKLGNYIIIHNLAIQCSTKKKFILKWTLYGIKVTKQITLNKSLTWILFHFVASLKYIFEN